MKNIAVIGLTLAGLASPAFGADMRAPMKAPAPVSVLTVYSWTGCYIGANGGYGWSRNSQTNTVNQNFAVNYGDFRPGQGFDSDANGWLAGGHLGCNYQTGQFVFGVEGSYDWANIKGSFANTNPLIGAADDVFSTKISGIASVVGRIGFAANNWLFYGKGGWATARYSLSAVDVIPPVVGSGGDAHWVNGWTVGGGVEYGVTPNWVIGVEGNYYRFGSTTYELGNPAAALAYTWSAKPRDLATVLGRISYKFGGM